MVGVMVDMVDEVSLPVEKWLRDSEEIMVGGSRNVSPPTNAFRILTFSTRW